MDGILESVERVMSLCLLQAAKHACPVRLDGSDRARLKWTRAYLETHDFENVLAGRDFFEILHANDSPLRHERICFTVGRSHWFSNHEDIHNVPWHFAGSIEEANSIYRFVDAAEHFGDSLEQAEEQWQQLTGSFTERQTSSAWYKAHSETRIEQTEKSRKPAPNNRRKPRVLTQA